MSPSSWVPVPKTHTRIIIPSLQQEKKKQLRQCLQFHLKLLEAAYSIYGVVISKFITFRCLVVPFYQWEYDSNFGDAAICFTSLSIRIKFMYKVCCFLK
jgi:hypothetical protein